MKRKAKKSRHHATSLHRQVGIKILSRAVFVLVLVLLLVSPALAFAADDAQISGSETSAGTGGGGGGTGGGTGGGGGGGTGVRLTDINIMRGEEMGVGERTEIAIEESVPTDYIPLHDSDKMFKFYFSFDKNVALANNGRDGAFIENNISLITLTELDGTEFKDYEVGTYISSGSERRTLFIFTYGWLKPLTTYQVIIEPGIQAANGVDVSTERYVITFTTDDMCSNGLRIYQNIMFLAIPIAIAAGIIAAVMRRRKLRYG